MPVKLIECPRDAWQGLKGMIPADLKVDYLKALISAGFKHIDAVSFVSPKAVPQMADSEEVLKELDPPDDVEIIGIVVNEKGAQRAIETQAVSTLGFPYSISETFLRNNQNQSPEEALEELEKIQKKADDARTRRRGLHLDGVRQSLWRPVECDEVVEAISLLEVENLRMISLADTVGMASAAADQRIGWRGDGEVRLPRNWRAPAQPSRAGGGEDSGRVRCRLPALRFRAGRTGWVSLRAGCFGWEYPDRESDRSAHAAGRGVAAI